MRVRVIINSSAGSCIGQDLSEVARAVEEQFQTAGHTCTVDLVAPAEMEAAVARTAASADMLVIGGGDGSVRTAALALLDSRVALGILPLGTLNRLALDLGIPFEPAAAAASLATGVRTAIDVGEVNGQIFLCNSMLGLPPRFAIHRQALRGKSLAKRISGYWRVLRELMATRHRITVELEDEHSSRQVRALSVVVSNNVYGAEPSAMLLRESLSEGKLGIYVSLHESGRQMMLAIVRAMMGRWKNDPDLEFGKVRRLSIHIPHRKRVRLSNDGEVAKFTPPLVYSIRPQALTVIEPAPTDASRTLRGKPLGDVVEHTPYDDVGAGTPPAPLERRIL